MLRLLNRLTLTQQWIIATLLALLPLVSAVLYAGWSLTVQTQSQRSMVETIDRLSSLDSSISTQVTDIERSARQYILLRSPKFLELYQQNVRNLQQQQEQWALLWPEQDIPLTLLTIASNVGRLLLPDMATVELAIESSTDSVQGELQRANNLVAQLKVEVDERIQTMLDDEERQFDRVIRRLLLIGFLAVPGTVLLVVLSSVAVARPMWRLAHAIRELGHEHWQRPISIDGPADLVSLGGSLEWMRRRLLTSEKQKRAFSRHVTHELKTPLAAIMEAGSLLQDEVPGPVTEPQRQVLQILMANADNLQELIQQLLNYNAVAHGLLAADAQVDVGAICFKIKGKLKDSRPASPCHWFIEGTPKTVRSDPQAVEMILSNLLSNAHDFAPDSGKVAVTWGADTTQWWLRVEDSGPGLTTEEQENIFKPFFQGKARRKGPLKGTGLGLAIVQECVTHLGGDIEVASSEGGSRFELRFPLRKEIII